jgi:hypothetical protein
MTNGAEGVDATEFIPADALGTPVAGEIAFLIQYDTLNVASVGQSEAMIRAIPGVRSATTTSLALGGTSVMQVTFGQNAEQLRAALAARGYSVLGSGTTLRIVRGAPQPPPAGNNVP